MWFERILRYPLWRFFFVNSSYSNKGTVSRNVRPRIFHGSNPSASLAHRLKYFSHMVAISPRYSRVRSAPCIIGTGESSSSSAIDITKSNILYLIFKGFFPNLKWQFHKVFDTVFAWFKLNLTNIGWMSWRYFLAIFLFFKNRTDTWEFFMT